MKAILLESRGGPEVLEARDVPDPPEPTGYDVLIRVKACSVNPVDLKVRMGTYDDYPDYFDRVPRPYQILGYDGSGTVESTGPQCTRLRPGDAVFYSGSPIRQGSNAELQLVDSRSVALKPSNLDFVEAATVPLTYITAYEALVERMEIPKGEKNAALLVINGAGGVGAMAIQIARRVLGMERVVATASREETQAFCREMGATEVVNHRGDLVKQVGELRLGVPLKYIFICSRTDDYMPIVSSLASPFAKVCSIVQGKVQMYGTEFMSKSMSFIWALLGTKPYHGVDLDSHGKILDEVKELIEQGHVKCTLKTRERLTLEGLRKGHELVASGKSIGKVGVGVDVEGEGIVLR